MEYYKDYFEKLYPVFGSSMVYRYLKPLPEEEFTRDLESLSLIDKVNLLESAIANNSKTVGEVLKCALAYCYLEHKEYELSRKVLRSVNLELKGEDPINDFSGIVSSNHSIVNSLLKKSIDVNR